MILFCGWKSVFGKIFVLKWRRNVFCISKINFLPWHNLNGSINCHSAVYYRFNFHYSFLNVKYPDEIFRYLTQYNNFCRTYYHSYIRYTWSFVDLLKYSNILFISAYHIFPLGCVSWNRFKLKYGNNFEICESYPFILYNSVLFEITNTRCMWSNSQN